MLENIITYINQHHIDIAASIIGLLYLYLEFRASIWMWLVSMVMALFFIYIFYTSQLYASMLIYVYFFFASGYGWFAWITKHRNKQTGKHIILRLPLKLIPLILIAISFSFCIISLLLYSLTDNNLYLLLGDAFTTALNVVALWMAARKWAEQWCLLIPANLISGILLMTQGQTASATMFFIYFIVSIFGYLNWKKIASQESI